MRGTLEVVLQAYLLAISTALMRPRRPKQYCLQLVIYMSAVSYINYIIYNINYTI